MEKQFIVDFSNETQEVVSKFANSQLKTKGKYFLHWKYVLFPLKNSSNSMWDSLDLFGSYKHLPVITYQEFLKQKEMDNFKLPKKWFIRPTTESNDILIKWGNGTYYGELNSVILISDKFWDKFDKLTNEYKDYKEITFEQFKKYVLMKEERKIIGYKAPIKLYDNVQAGSIFVKAKNPTHYYLESFNIYLPAQIVETWEAVYEEINPSKNIALKHNDYRLNICKDGTIGTLNGDFTIEEFKEYFQDFLNLKEIAKDNFKKWAVRYDNITIELACRGQWGSGVRVTLDELKTILSTYNELNK